LAHQLPARTRKTSNTQRTVVRKQPAAYCLLTLLLVLPITRLPSLKTLMMSFTVNTFTLSLLMRMKRMFNSAIQTTSLMRTGSWNRLEPCLGEENRFQGLWGDEMVPLGSIRGVCWHRPCIGLSRWRRDKAEMELRANVVADVEQSGMEAFKEGRRRLKDIDVMVMS